jgi:hypothetical protein
MAKTIICPAGEWTTIFEHAFVQLPWGWTVTFSATDGGEIEGEIMEKRSSWIFPGAPATLPLTPVMEFHRGWFNTFYSVRVKPARDTIAEITRSSMG